MAFEGVNVTSARNALNSCMNTISYSKTSQIISNIQNNDIWNTSSRDVLNEALNKLINIKYKDVKEKINLYLTTVGLIEQYQNLQNQLNDVNNKIKELENKLTTEKSNKRTYEKNKEKNASKIKQAQGNISSYTTKLNQLYKQQQDLENRMATIKSQIESNVNAK